MFICLLLGVEYKLMMGGILFDLFAAVSLALTKASDTKDAINIVEGMNRYFREGLIGMLFIHSSRYSDGICHCKLEYQNAKHLWYLSLITFRNINTH